MSIYEQNVQINGKTFHLVKTAEECSELAAAILQNISKGASEDAILSEIADVEIAIKHLSIIYGRTKINKAKRAKLQRIAQKLKEQHEAAQHQCTRRQHRSPRRAPR